MSKDSVEKKNTVKKQVKVMVFGTFDGLHEGHINFFKQAKSLSKDSFLIVSIARDKNVLRIKGLLPRRNEKERKILVGRNTLVDKVILGNVHDYLAHILKIKPAIIALGYDQKAYVRTLRKDLRDKGVFVKIVRLKPYKEKIYKNHLLNKLL
ncbi:MAG: adenylyltransferase/cytidyltransferase family protein [Patescibacteria group bacterium]